MKINSNIIFGFFLLSMLFISCSKKITDEQLAKYLNAKNDYESARIEEANIAFAELQKDNKSFYQAAFMNGKCSFMLGNLDNAKKIFSKLKKSIPEYTEASFWLARTEAQMGDLVEAKKQFSKLLSYDNRNPNILYQLSLIAMEEEDIPSALDYMQRAEAYSEEFSSIYLQLGRLYYQYGYIDKSIQILTKSLALLPEDHPRYKGIINLKKEIIKKSIQSDQ